jgi:hypothetical protein
MAASRAAGSTFISSCGLGGVFSIFRAMRKVTSSSRTFGGFVHAMPLSSVRVKIDRAKKHLTHLDAAIRAFEAGRPYRVGMNNDASDPSHEIYYFKLLTPIPDEWGAIVGDCVYNLRSALDHLAAALVKANGGTPGDYTAFPVGSDKRHFETSAIKRIDGASAAAIQIASELNPYPGGDDTIWRIHRLDIADKHVLLIPVAAAHKVFGVRHDIQGPGLEHFLPGQMLRGPAVSRKFPLKDGDELGGYRRVLDAGYQDNTEFDFGFEIAFGEGQIFDGQAVIPTLTQLTDHTTGVIDIFAQRIFGTAAW